MNNNNHQAFYFFANVIKRNPEIGRKAGEDFNKLSKKEQTAKAMGDLIWGHFAFMMHSTYGFPYELTLEEVNKILNERSYISEAKDNRVEL